MRSATAIGLNHQGVSCVDRSSPALRVVALVFGAAAALAIVAHLVVSLWAQHEFTQVESIVAMHSNALAEGEGLYYDLNSYPFTVSPYGPVFYSLSALLQKAGAPLLAAGRVLSFIALLASLWILWRGLGCMIEDRRVVWAGVLLAACNANLLFWAATGQTDMLACCFSLWAFTEFLAWRKERANWRLVTAGLFVALAIFTKQTMLAAGAAIAISLFIEDRKRGIQWIAALAAAGAAVALILNWATAGHYFDNAIRANLNPFAAAKLWSQASYLLLANAGLLLIAVLGIRDGLRRYAPLYLYTALTGGVWLLTASKIGSDLNYQVEFSLALTMCAACSLGSLHFFRELLERRHSWVTLLQLPLLVFIVLNLALTANSIAGRVALEPVKQTEANALRPYLDSNAGRLLTTHLGPLVQTRRRMEVEPLIYTLLVGAGMTDPEPVRGDLSAGRFETVILYEDIFAPEPAWKNAEVPSLPAAHLEEMRKNYRLVRRIPGPMLDGVYVYEPLRD